MLESAVSEARAARCSGLAPLDFQPVCRCGFDGANGPLQPILSRFEDAAGSLERELTLFFQQDPVKAKVKDWADQGLEMNTRTLSYLEGKAEYPEVENLALFDQHFSGLNLVHPVEARPLIDLLNQRVWEKPALMRALDQFLDRYGPRISFRFEETLEREDLAAWCCEQALRQGCPLPRGLSSAERATIPRLIQPQWVSEQSLLNIENMELGEPAILRILEMLLSGLLRAPAPRPSSGAVAAALDLLEPSHPDSAEELAGLLACLYEQSGRFLKLRPQLWLSHLDRLATIQLKKTPEDLVRLLQLRMDFQWIVVDCLGIPLARAIQDILPDCFSGWKLSSVEYAAVSRQTSTEAFYLGLIGGDLTKSFEKIDAVDSLIHERKLSFADLKKLVRAELEVAFRKIIQRLDPGRPVLIYGDHGFRLAPDGSGFMHGGPSTAERLIPVFSLIP